MATAGLRNDAVTNLLNELGYQPLVLAKSGLKAPYVYSYRDTKLEPLGHLSDFLLPHTEQPELEVGDVPEISQKETDKKSGSAIAGFLGDALKALGITAPPKLNAALARDKEFVFSFENVTSEGLSYSQTSKLLRSIDITSLEDLPSGDLEGGYIHVAYDYLFAGSLGMRDVSGTGFSADGKAIEIKDIVDVGAGLKVEKKSDNAVSFKSDTKRVAFACKIGWLQKMGDKFKLHIYEDPGEGFLDEEGGPKPYLLERGVAIREEGA